MLSKRAGLMDQAKDQIKKLWSPNKGPFENLLNLSSYLLPFVGGWVVFGIEQVASLKGYGLKDFGKYLDSNLGLGPGSNIGTRELQMLEGLLNTASTNNDGLEKKAIGRALMAGGAVKLIYTLIKFVLLAVGAETIKELYAPKSTTPATTDADKKEELMPDITEGLKNLKYLFPTT